MVWNVLSPGSYGAVIAVRDHDEGVDRGVADTARVEHASDGAAQHRRHIIFAPQNWHVASTHINVPLTP